MAVYPNEFDIMRRINPFPKASIDFIEKTPAVTTKATVEHLIKNESLIRAWVDGKVLEYAYHGDSLWFDVPQVGVALDFVKYKYRIKPVKVVRYAVYNCTPANPGDDPYFLCDFPKLEAAQTYVARHFGNDAAFGLTKADRDLRIVELKSEIYL